MPLPVHYLDRPISNPYFTGICFSFASSALGNVNSSTPSLNSIYFTPFTDSVALKPVQLRAYQCDMTLVQDGQKLAERLTTYTNVRGL